MVSVTYPYDGTTCTFVVDEWKINKIEGRPALILDGEGCHNVKKLILFLDREISIGYCRADGKCRVVVKGKKSKYIIHHAPPDMVGKIKEVIE